jgi:uncharacterized protein
MIWIPANLADRGMLHVHVSPKLLLMAQVAPALAALLTVGWFQGSGAVKALLAPIVRIKVSYRWYALVLFGPFAAWALAMLAYRLMGRPVPALGEWVDTPLLIVLGAPLCLGEELGWRGFLLDRLMQRNSLLVATGWTAFWWGIWHLPVHLVPNHGWWFILFLVSMFPVSAVFTFVYVRTRSVFLCVLLHASIDAGANYWLAPLPQGDLLYLGLMDAVLWLAAIPVFVGLAKSPRPDFCESAS